MTMQEIEFFVDIQTTVFKQLHTLQHGLHLINPITCLIMICQRSGIRLLFVRDLAQLKSFFSRV